MLTGPEIEREIEEGNIEVDPFDPSNISPNSLDLTLSEDLKVYVNDQGTPLDVAYDDARNIYPQNGVANQRKKLVEYLQSEGSILDMRQRPETKKLTIPEDGRVLLPGRGYLGRTDERVSTDHYVPVLQGRSSLGRLFVEVHHTAGWGDVGWSGSWTLEIRVLHPIRVYPGVRVCQVGFHPIDGERLLYRDRRGSKYEGQKEPEESRMFLDFDEDQS